LIPIGISFYSFRLISYIIDISREKIEPIKDALVFHNYISFFPTILSGPIDRANKFLPQLEEKRTFSYPLCVLAFRQILWGLFKKMVIADNCAEITANVFDNYMALPASSLVLGAILYTVQMYSDFSGYSDIAIGFGKLLGFEVNKNFNYPFFATNIAEFWRNWHMSLTTWLTEYVFTPLTIFFRNLGKWGLILSITINFAICGLWHGASWTYVLFGVLNGIYFIPVILGDKMYKKRKKGAKYTVVDFLKMAMVFSMFMLSLLIFRASSMNDFFHQMSHLFSGSLFEVPYIPFNKPLIIQTSIFIVIMFVAEWFTKQYDFPLFKIEQKLSKPIRYTVYYLILIAILVFQTKTENFIYVQF
jgi:alginate O-acetyltransferase complex protein AlgI